MFAPTIAPVALKNIRTNLPCRDINFSHRKRDRIFVLTKRDELSFFIVCALPKASRIGLASIILRSSWPSSGDVVLWASA